VFIKTTNLLLLIGVKLKISEISKKRFSNIFTNYFIKKELKSTAHCMSIKISNKKYFLYF